MTPQEVSERIDKVLTVMEEELSDVITTYHDKELDAMILRLYDLQCEYDDSLSVTLSHDLALALGQLHA